MMATGMTSSPPLTITKTILNSDDKKNSIDDKLSLGQFIHVNQHYGFITFISEQYLTLASMNTPNPNKSQKGQDANITNAMYSSSENNGTTLEEQLTYIKDTSKELISIPVE